MNFIEESKILVNLSKVKMEMGKYIDGQLYKILFYFKDNGEIWFKFVYMFDLCILEFFV